MVEEKKITEHLCKKLHDRGEQFSSCDHPLFEQREPCEWCKQAAAIIVEEIEKVKKDRCI